MFQTTNQSYGEMVKNSDSTGCSIADLLSPKTRQSYGETSDLIGETSLSKYVKTLMFTAVLVDVETHLEDKNIDKLPLGPGFHQILPPLLQ